MVFRTIKNTSPFSVLDGNVHIRSFCPESMGKRYPRVAHILVTEEVESIGQMESRNAEGIFDLNALDDIIEALLLVRGELIDEQGEV